VSQTTFNYRKFQELVEIIKGLGYDVEVMNTICNATKERQVEAMELAAVSDVMLVIGGKNSSNTQKLYDICMGRCARTYFISTPDDLREICFADADKVGITAGASTPNTLIQEVSQYVRRAEL
jgi:4-hydroxy-3-methylbut-2-enyl diphosphate reductase